MIRNPKIQGGVLAGKYHFISSQILRNCQLQLNAKIKLYYTYFQLWLKYLASHHIEGETRYVGCGEKSISSKTYQ
jgi:hypothetical protein